VAPGNPGGDDILQLFRVYGYEAFDILYQKLDRLLYFGTHGLSYGKTGEPTRPPRRGDIQIQ
jgi:hypothetical protein